MRALAYSLTLIVVVAHLGFAVAEMAFWQHPIVMARFGSSPEFARASAVLAGNLGLYNGLFAVAIAWALFTWQRSTLMVLLGCIVVAGIYGGATAKPAIFLVQGLPALLAFGATWLAGGGRNGV
jgi:putative membrane protein